MGRMHKNKQPKITTIDDPLPGLPEGNKCDECGGKKEVTCPKCKSLYCKPCLKRNKGICYSCDHKLGAV